MAYLILPSRRTRQPQGPVQVDWSNPLSSSLVIASIGNQPGYNAANSKAVIAINSAGTRPGPAGIGLSWASTANVGVRVNSTTALTRGFLSSTGGISVFVLADPQASTTRYLPFSSAKAAQPEFTVYFNADKSGTASSGTFAVSTRGANGGQVSSAINGSARLFGVVFSGPAGAPDLYVDGVELGTSKTAASSSELNDASCSDYVGGYLSSGYAATGFGQYLTLAFNRSLSALEVVELSRNPWQIFAPDPRRLYFGVSGGAGVYELDAQPGGYTVSGTAATLARGIVLDAQPASYTLTGTAATLVRGYNLDAQPGSYTVTGTAATLARGYVVNAAPGSYALTGIAATLDKVTPGVYTLDAQPGAYSLTGVAATLTYTPLNAYTLDAQPGSYTITGIAAELTYAGASIWTDVGVSAATWSDVGGASSIWSDL